LNRQVTFGDVIAHDGQFHVVFAGREVGSHTGVDGTTRPLEARTSRYFRYEDGRWRQYHHHGSIDDPDALRAYQQAFRTQRCARVRLEQHAGLEQSGNGSAQPLLQTIWSKWPCLGASV
jgi:SnoaL-like domain